MENRRDTSRQLADILLDVMRNENITHNMLNSRAASLWALIVGPTVNRATKSVHVNNGVMYVELTSSLLRQELMMIRTEIMNRINKACGEGVVKEIVFR